MSRDRLPREVGLRAGQPGERLFVAFVPFVAQSVFVLLCACVIVSFVVNALSL